MSGTNPRRRRVVIVGGGFGGIAAATALRRTDVDVVVIDRRNHHVFQPLLYQVATAGLNASDIAQPIRSMLRGQRNATVVLAEVTAIDTGARTVTLDGTETRPYDTLILATGSRHHYFGNDEWSAHAPGLKTIDDALDVRRRIFTAFESAERHVDEDDRRALLTFVVVGGGPTGVELAGALREIMARAMTSEFRSIDPTSARVVLVEGGDRVLPAYPEALSCEAQRHLRELGVEVQTDRRVVGVDAGGVDTSAGRIASRTVLWAAGVAASSLGQHLGVPLDRAGRVIVQSDLSVPDHPEILVIGDLAAATQHDGTPVPGVAPAAARAGRHAAAVVRADLHGRARPVFRYRHKGAMATIGRSRAVADLGRVGRVSGFGAWVLWWLVHLAYLRGIRNRFAVWIGLIYQSATLRREARLITSTAGAEHEPISSTGAGLLRIEPTVTPNTGDPAAAALRIVI
jgi:NADH dehydrogenase